MPTGGARCVLALPLRAHAAEASSERDAESVRLWAHALRGWCTACSAWLPQCHDVFETANCVQAKQRTPLRHATPLRHVTP